MSTAAPPPTAPSPAAPPPPAPPPAGPSTEQVVGIVGGGVLALIGVLLILGGAAILALFGSDGTVSSSREPLTSTGTALVSESGTIEDSAGIARTLGDTRLQVSADPGTFVGIGRTPDVDRYLRGAPVDEVTDVDVDPFRLARRPSGGRATPAPPGRQDFWVARSAPSGEAKIDWRVRDGAYRLVIMRNDGARGLDTRGSFGVEVPNVPVYGALALGAGLLLVAGGVVLIVGMARRRPS
jgi:hypothetical protein